MHISVGTDLVEVDRIKKLLSRPRFWSRVFGEQERTYLLALSSACMAQSAAACFAAKEAFGKAMGTGISSFSLTEVQVIHAENGAPSLHLSGKAKALSDKLGYTKFSLSLAHTKRYATATLIAYGDEV